MYVQELTRYEAALWRHPETDKGVVRAAQHRTTAAELGILPSDNLSDLASVPTRIAFLNQLADRVRLLQHFLTMWALPSSRPQPAGRRGAFAAACVQDCMRSICTVPIYHASCMGLRCLRNIGDAS